MDAPTAVMLMMGIQAVGKPAGDVSKDLIVRLLGPSVDIAGDGLKKWFENRSNRGHENVVAAAGILAKTGVAVRPVPGRILLPILEHGSLEEDDDLRRKWVALLVNSASEIQGPFILPAYAEILRQLTPVHAKILDWIFENAEQPSAEEPTISAWRDVRADEVTHRFGLNTADYQIVASDLHRLQVIDGPRYVKSRLGGSASVASTFKVIGLTPLGIAFIKACRVPTSIDQSE